MGPSAPLPAMLATLGGTLALLLGLVILLLPLLVTELSRPRDSFWGAVVLLLGLVLVTTTERLTGAPMLAVLCGGLLIGRLGSEVGLGRWRQLTPEEQQRLGSTERWRSSLAQLAASCASLLGMAASALGGVGAWITERRQPRLSTKRWVRPEAASPPQEEGSGKEGADQLAEVQQAEAQLAEPAPDPLAKAAADVLPTTWVVSNFEEIDALLGQAVAEPMAEPISTALEEPVGKPAEGETGGEPEVTGVRNNEAG